MHTRTAIICAALAALGVESPAVAMQNPVVAEITPVGAAGAHGNATFFQLGESINVGVNLSHDPNGTLALDLRKGTCKSYADTAKWPLGTFDGTSDQLRLPNTKLESLAGSVLLIHKTSSDNSPVIGCAEIKV